MHEAWERIPLLALGSSQEPGLFDGDSHQLAIAATPAARSISVSRRAVS